MNPNKVTLEITSDGWLYTVLANGKEMARHEMRRTPMGWKGVGKGGIADKLPKDMEELAEAMESVEPDEIAQALAGF